MGRARAAVVDAHLHVWDLERSEYGWLTPELGPLYATYTPEQAQGELAAAGIDSAVLVQAEDSERDTDLMLEAADRHPWIAGVVGWVQLDDPATAERQLERRDRRLLGVRSASRKCGDECGDEQEARHGM